MDSLGSKSRVELLDQGMYPLTHPKDWSWLFWAAVPLYPYGRRRTLRKEIVEDTIWRFDQLHGILYTIVPIRMTIIKLAAGFIKELEVGLVKRGIATPAKEKV